MSELQHIFALVLIAILAVIGVTWYFFGWYVPAVIGVVFLTAIRISSAEDKYDTSIEIYQPNQSKTPKPPKQLKPNIQVPQVKDWEKHL